MDARKIAEEKSDLAAVKKNWRSLADIPLERQTLAVCQAAVEQDSMALQYIKEPRAEPLPEQFYLDAINKKYYVFRYVPPSQMSEKLCQEAVARSGSNLEAVPPELRLKYKSLYALAVADFGGAIKFVPDTELTEALCLAAVNNMAEFKDIPDRYRTRAVSLAAVVKNSQVFLNLPEQWKSDAGFCLDAVQTNGLVLAEISEDGQSKAICLQAVQQNPQALKHVKSDENKRYCIEQIGIEKLLEREYPVRRYFPKDAYEKEIKAFLSKIAHVVVVPHYRYMLTQEVRDAYNIYANKEAREDQDPAKYRKGKTLWARQKDLEETLSATQQNPTINLVLLAHLPELNKLVGEEAQHVNQILERHSNINRVTLLGCSTADASVLEQEKQANAAMRKYYAQHTPQGKCGLAYMTHMPDEETGKKLLKNRDACYVIVVDKGIQKCCLLQNNSSVEDSDLSAEHVEVFRNKLYDKNKNFKIPKGSAFQMVKDNLTFPQKAFIYDVLNNTQAMLSKTHPRYKDQKQYHPFLRSAHVHLQEEKDALKKLQPSLLTTVVNRILGNAKIQQAVAVKGYRHRLVVDTAGRGFKVISPDKGEYVTDYSSRGIYNPSFFTEKRQSLKELEKYSTKKQEEILAEEKEGKAEKGHSKSIVFHVPGKK